MLFCDRAAPSSLNTSTVPIFHPGKWLAWPLALTVTEEAGRSGIPGNPTGAAFGSGFRVRVRRFLSPLTSAEARQENTVIPARLCLPYLSHTAKRLQDRLGSVSVFPLRAAPVYSGRFVKLPQPPKTHALVFLISLQQSGKSAERPPRRCTRSATLAFARSLLQ